MVQIFNRRVFRRVDQWLGPAVRIDIGPVITVAAAAVSRRSRDACMAGAAVDAVVHGSIVVIRACVGHPGRRGVARLAALNHRQAGVALRTVAGSKSR